MTEIRDSLCSVELINRTTWDHNELKWAIVIIWGSALAWLSQNRDIHLSKESIVFQVIILFILMFQNYSLVSFS